MFDVGFAELVLVFVIGLLVLGPERLPKVAAEIGKWVGRARRTATQLRRQLEREVELNEVIQPSKPVVRAPPPSTPPQAESAVAPTAGQPTTSPSTVAPEGAPSTPTDEPPRA